MSDGGSSRSIFGRIERLLAAATASLYLTLERNVVTRIPWAVIQTFSRAQGALMSGSMAYFTFLSLLPLLLVAGFVVGTLTVGDVDLRDGLAESVERSIPGAEGKELVGQLVRSRAAFGLLGLITVAYAGSGFVGALTACLNRMWDVPTGRNPIGQKLLNLGVVVLLGVVLLGSVATTIWVRYVSRVLLGADATVARWSELVASPVALFVVLVILYRVLPARTVRWRAHIGGAVFATLGVEALKQTFTFWADRSAGVSALPRSLVSIVLLLVWMGLFAQIILYGAALNVVLERRRRRVGMTPRGAEERAGPSG